ncbi:MAG: hypothetical protein IJZ00_08365 [Lachnospiraceae bacterium]|nr:hypothetical protein [Lachnospiraceae bacterium]
MKSKFSSISFWLMCVITAFFVFDKLFSMKLLVEQFGGMEAIKNTLSPMKTANVVWFYGHHFVQPILFCVLFIAFLVQMGRKERLTSRVLGFAFAAALMEAALLVLSYLMRGIFVPLFPLFIRIVFLTLLFLLLLDAKNKSYDNAIYIAASVMGVVTLISLVLDFDGKGQMLLSLLQTSEISRQISLQISRLYIVTDYFLLPIFEPLAFALVIAYYRLYDVWFPSEEKEKTYY